MLTLAEIGFSGVRKIIVIDKVPTGIIWGINVNQLNLSEVGILNELECFE